MSQKITIAVIEDHQATLEGLSAVLGREEDFQIVGSSDNSDDGLKMVETLKPQIAILDLHLPGKLAPKYMIDEFVRVTDLKVVIYSAESRLAFIQGVMSMGVSAYLLKSERLSTLADVIRRVVKGEKGIVSEALTYDYRKLTPSEHEVVQMLGRGMKYQDIADARNTSISTVRKQCEVLLLKLDLKTREQLIAWSVQNGYGSAEF
jgi:two-component system nitrate/nitrite response regulator NarL